VAPAVAGSAVLFLAERLAWWDLGAGALRFLVNYASGCVEPILVISAYLDFVLLLMVATGLAFLSAGAAVAARGVRPLHLGGTMRAPGASVVARGGNRLRGGLTPSTDPVHDAAASAARSPRCS